MTYLRTGTRSRSLAVIWAAFSRARRGWALSRSLSQDHPLDALKMALTKGAPPIFHADQASQSSAWLPTDRLDTAGSRLRLSERGNPTQNGSAERFRRTR